VANKVRFDVNKNWHSSKGGSVWIVLLKVSFLRFQIARMNNTFQSKDNKFDLFGFCGLPFKNLFRNFERINV